MVERTLAWITSYRRCARDYERLLGHHEATVASSTRGFTTPQTATPTVTNPGATQDQDEKPQSLPLDPGTRLHQP